MYQHVNKYPARRTARSAGKSTAVSDLLPNATEIAREVPSSSEAPATVPTAASQAKAKSAGRIMAFGKLLGELNSAGYPIAFR